MSRLAATEGASVTESFVSRRGQGSPATYRIRRIYRVRSTSRAACGNSFVLCLPHRGRGTACGGRGTQRENCQSIAPSVATRHLPRGGGRVTKVFLVRNSRRLRQFIRSPVPLIGACATSFDRLRSTSLTKSHHCCAATHHCAAHVSPVPSRRARAAYRLTVPPARLHIASLDISRAKHISCA